MSVHQTEHVGDDGSRYLIVALCNSLISQTERIPHTALGCTGQ